MSGVDFGVDATGTVFAVIDGQPVDESKVDRLLQLTLVKQLGILNSYAEEAHERVRLAQESAEQMSAAEYQREARYHGG